MSVNRTKFGMNLSGVSYYGQALPYIDMLRTSLGWFGGGSAWGETPQGYFSAIPAAGGVGPFVYLRTYPFQDVFTTNSHIRAGRYYALLSGKASVVWNGGTPSYVTSAGNLVSCIEFLFTVDTLNFKIQKIAHGLSNGDMIVFRNGTAPSPLVRDAPNSQGGVIYFVVNATANDFQVAAKSGGPALSLQSQATAYCSRLARWAADLADPEVQLFLALGNTDPTNTTEASNSNGNRFAVFHQNDEADYLAGEIFQRDWVERHTKAEAIRTMDWHVCNDTWPDSTSLEISDFLSMDDRAWYWQGNTKNLVGKFVPPEVIGLLMKKLGNNCDLWNTVHPKWSQSCMTTWYARLKAACNGWKGNIINEFGNEVWWEPTRPWIRDFKAAGLDVNGSGSPITIYDDSGTAISYASANDDQKIFSAMGLGVWQLYNACVASFGVERAKMAIGTQLGVVGRGAPAFYVVNPLNSSQKAKDVLDYWVNAFYIFLGGGVPTANIPSLSVKEICENKRYLQPDQDWADILITNIDVYGAYPQLQSDWLAAISPKARFTYYEAGLDITIFNLWQSDTSRTYQFIVDSTGNTSLDLGSDLTAAFENGEYLSFAWHGNVVITAQQPVQLNWQQPYPIRRNGTNKLWVYPTIAAYNADTTPNGAGAFQLGVNGGVTQFSITNITRANPAVVTYSGSIDPDVNGLIVDISGVAGMTQINGQRCYIENINPASNTFQLYKFSDGFPLDSTGFTSYTSGGVAKIVYWINNATRYEACQNKIMNMLSGEVGKKVMAYKYKTVVKGKAAHYMQFSDIGWSGLGFAWGVVQTQFGTNTRLGYLEDLPKRPVSPAGRRSY